jgi:membrane protease YdiL (CAAX protease family)
VIKNPYPIPQKNRILTIIAWSTIGLVSTLPEIVFIKLTGSVPIWLTFSKMGLVLVAGIVAFIWKPLRPLRNFFLALLVFFSLNQLRLSLDFSLPTVRSIFGNNVFDIRMQAEQTSKLVIALVMILILFNLGYENRDFFLTIGSLHAPIKPVPLLGFPKPDPWPKFGLQWGFYIAAALAIVQYLGLQPDMELMLKVVPILPSILFYAALNAFNEEILYRSPLLATLEPIAGSRNALWISAYFFGIAHYFGTPGGLVGGIASIFMGWILGKAMLETRGLFWSWWIHFLSDIAIFSFLTMALIQSQ